MSSRHASGFCIALALTLGAHVAAAETAILSHFRAELALRWAPIHHQDVHRRGEHALGGAADFITSFDFDGDDDPRNNWEHAGDPRYPLAAHAYYAVVETPSHWFITYQFLHPRDWSSTFFETEHENDSEGVLLAIARDGSRFGAVRAAVTVVHSNFYSYVPASSRWAAGQEDIDGALTLRPYLGELHPVTAQEAETHALKAWPYYSIKNEGVVYYPSLTTAEVPSGPNDRSVLYQLHDVLEPAGLWARRNDARVFSSFGRYGGDAEGGCGKGAFLCRRNSASAPWGWNDHDDRVASGAMVSDPVSLAASYFRPSERLSKRYSLNPFR
jgi:hypothetical protein